MATTKRTQRDACKDCNGRGVTRATAPVVKREKYTDNKGVVKHRHTTIKQGSGCPTCHGKVVE